jgi:hypothetical protein
MAAVKKDGGVAARFGKGLNPFDKKGWGAVGRSSEFKRVFNLPRRTTWSDVSSALTIAFALPDRKDCTPACVCRGTGSMRLRPRQAWALAEFFEQRGGIALLGPGEGKTLVSLLLSELLGWQRPVLFVPAGLRDKTVKIDLPALARHWRLPANLDIRSYEELSRVAFADYLAKRRVPDGIICDEVHALKNRGAARTKRLLRFFSEFPQTEFIGMSGSIVNRSLMDYGHLTLLSLKDGAPLPHGFIELKTWADALDEGVPDEARPKPGALLDLCGPDETPRDGYRRRLLETPGVISSPDLSTTVGLQIFEEAMPAIPPAVIEAFVRLRNTAELPGGEMCATALEQVRHAKELVLGFYYRWVWPNGVRDEEWLEARRAWRSFVRKMTTRSHGGVWYDTELQVANGVRSGALLCPDDEYNRWVTVREDRRKKWGAVEPPKETVWLSDYMIAFVEAWLKESEKETLPGAIGPGAIVWVESIGFLEEMRRRGHVCYGAGENGISYEDGNRSVFASMAHTVGKNLQAFSKMFFTSPLTSGKAWEQALAREHRPGQTADDVIVHVLLGCRETWWSFWNARRDARYIESTLGQRQRLNQATIIATEEDEVIRRHESGSPLWAATGLARLDAANTHAPAEQSEVEQSEQETTQQE